MLILIQTPKPYGILLLYGFKVLPFPDPDPRCIPSARRAEVASSQGNQGKNNNPCTTLVLTHVLTVHASSYYRISYRNGVWRTSCGGFFIYKIHPVIYMSQLNTCRTHPYPPHALHQRVQAQRPPLPSSSHRWAGRPRRHVVVAERGGHEPQLGEP